MKQLIIFYVFICCTTIQLNAQKKNDCPILDGITDTVICDGKEMILELSFCESNGQYYDGILTDLNGKEEFYFFYKYDNKHNLTRITFWTFNWNNGGLVTKDKIGYLKIKRATQELIIKNGFILNREFVKLVTKT